MRNHRTTITVPADLKIRMNALGDRVNWSAVASEAFRVVCDREETSRVSGSNPLVNVVNVSASFDGE
jgi:hypothetical protein